MSEELKQWLAERCPENQLAFKDGIAYLPNDTCERKLDYMDGEFGIVWNTENYKSSFYFNNNQHWVSASLELVLRKRQGLAYEEIKRLVGCATFKAQDYYPNTHLDATAKSLCLVNAAMDLGDQFGRFLSVQTRPQEVKTKLKPDMIIWKKFEKAIKDHDEQTIMEIKENYEIEYTDLKLVKE